MVSGTRPATEKEERIPVAGPITLIFEDHALTIAAELKDVSPSGLRVEHLCRWLKPGVVARVCHPTLDKKVRVVWVRSVGDRIQSGLLHQETYLISRTLAGDETAFAELVGPYLHSLQFAIQAILRNWADAEEAMQEALLKVALHLNQFRPGCDLKPWLYRIASREALKRLRWNRRHTHDLIEKCEEDDPTWNALEQIADPGGSPAEILERKEFADAISAALESLSKIYREIFVACDLHQAPVKETACLLGINIDTANTRLHRARLQMRKLLLRN
jgi:RNA polymerase sigma-70 factor (ECF subfamily)